jgi:hypothetical protein
VSRTVAAGLKESAQAIAISHLRDDRDGLTHPIHLVRLILDLNHATRHRTAFLASKTKRRAYSHREDSNKHPIIDVRRHHERRVSTFGGHATVFRLFPPFPQRIAPTHLRNAPKSIVRGRQPLAIATLAPSTPDSLSPRILDEFVRYIVAILDTEGPMETKPKAGGRILEIIVRKSATLALIKDERLERL